MINISTSSNEYRALHSAKTQCAAQYLQPRIDSPFRRLTAAVSSAPETNVLGVGIGEKVTNGQPTGTPCIKIWVEYKYEAGLISSNHLLPKEIDGLPVDIEASGKFVTLATPNPQTRIRPAQPGCSVGFENPVFRMAGTFGALVQRGDQKYILSNNHVLADENRLPLGSPIFQPGTLDGGNPALDQIASLTQFVCLQTTQPNSVDAAIALLTNFTIANNQILGIGTPKSPTHATIGMQVQKFGRTTSHTLGHITSIDTDVKVGYEMGELLFTNQIVIVSNDTKPFSAAGDSGSLIVENPTSHAVGLLFAGSDTHTIANDIELVLQALNVTLG